MQNILNSKSHDNDRCVKPMICLNCLYTSAKDPSTPRYIIVPLARYSVGET